MNIDLTGKTALVTGAGKGIGRATSILLAECGASVIALSRTQADLDSLVAECGGNVKTICADLVELDTAIKEIQSSCDHIDLLVNNAACLIHIPSILNVTEDDINKAVKLNVTVPLCLSQMISRDLIKRGLGGAIVNVSSVVADRFSGSTAPYGITKAALDNLTKTFAIELAPYKIRVNSILPGLTNTPSVQGCIELQGVQALLKQTPKGQMAEAREIAQTIVYLLSDYSNNITGARIVCDGGFHCN
ncbi:L-xylulose reductase-like [Xenia sp. Carnegie-2017]|uniref:L-xylulose reductase-like n=1 Tax=Xenia sp. Carnegie-2017 TaxID=2897299 RepID=UPI001F04C5FE|nr:L-xylulose reductase-like [Xenia sp. Carnegie-2017]